MRSNAFLIASLIIGLGTTPTWAQTLPGTKLLEEKRDFARVMLDGMDRFLDKMLAVAPAQREAKWAKEITFDDNFEAKIQPYRDRLKHLIGVVDARPKFDELEYVGGTTTPSLVAETPQFKVFAVRWPALRGMHAEGLYLLPNGKPVGGAIVFPDASSTPEQIAGLEPASNGDRPTARHLAMQGWAVLVPTPISRGTQFSGNPDIQRTTVQPHREFVYRMAFEFGRHVIGYEVQKTLAAVDWFEKQKLPKIGVWGWGEGGLIGLYSAAIDPRITETHISGYVRSREHLPKEPIDRNVWALLTEFGDAELLAMAGAKTKGRSLEVVAAPEPTLQGPPIASKGYTGPTPGDLGDLKADDTKREWDRLAKLGAAPLPSGFREAKGSPFGFASDEAMLKDRREKFNAQARQQRQVKEAIDFTQALLPESVRKRHDTFWSKLDTKSIDAFKNSQKPLRDRMWNQLIGKLPEPTMPLNPRSRLVYDTPKWKGYEVVLDVYEDVIAYGILLVPNDLKPGEKRPVVVCQHGLEGRPTDIVDPKQKTKFYNSFGAQLADQGYIVFAPQNPYIFKNEFRQVVRKANPLGLSIYSFIARQHERILQFLGTLDFVDTAKIAYYGLSYGGKVAMRIPSLLEGYCLSICSGDFNEWVWKNITLDWGGSYMFSGEYEMYEFDLANTFSYAEMATLIAPRPFMVERGHDDGVGLDEHVAFEYAKVRRLYAKLGIADRTEIEFFSGGHEIHGVGTFEFLRRHLKGK
jgi:cephalosporin-C deacetylase-like acetyl esterase